MYRWNCESADIYPTLSGSNNVIYNVHWMVEKEDDETAEIVFINGTHILDISNVGTENFTDFSNITHETLIGWTTASLGESIVNQIYQNLDLRLANKEQPIFETVTIEK